MNDLSLSFADFFEFNVSKDGKRCCTINIDAMTLMLAEGKNTKIVSQVIEDIMKVNQILSGKGKDWVHKAESERDIVYLVQNSYDLNYFLSELVDNLGMEEKLMIFESEALV